MARLADGDPAAFDSVFDTLWPILLRYCSKTLSSTADGEDAAQRALLKLLHNAPNYERGRSALAWALGFAFWECRTERTRRRRSATEPETRGVAEFTPEDLTARKQQHDLLFAVLSELSDEERALIERELSPVFEGVNDAALRKRRQRLLARLRTACLALLRPESVK